jgi:transposase
MDTDLCRSLLPTPHHLRVDTINLTTHPLSLHVTSIQPTPPCPTCGTAGHRIHSGYVRTLADLPWAGLAASIFLQVRRFFCDQPTCGRRTFTERVPAIAASSAHRTTRLAREQSAVGLALGGAAGARLAAEQGLPTSRNTLLRLVRALPIPEAAPARVIGIDDWSQRKGNTYGTILMLRS